MTKTTIQIDISPLTHRIYIGRAVPGANHWAGDKTDVTEQAIHCAAEHIIGKFGGDMTLTITPPGQPRIAYYIKVEKYIDGKEVKANTEE